MALDTVDTSEMTDLDFVCPIVGIFAVTDKDGLEVKLGGFYVE